MVDETREPDEFDRMAQVAVDFVRDTWNRRRPEIRKWLIEEKRFNPKSVERFIDNYIDSIVFVAEAQSRVDAATARAKKGG